MEPEKVWRSFYGVQVPIAYLLRPQNTEVWFRIHTLPESKRYAANESETQEILRRYNTVANEVLREGAHCVLFLPDYAVEKLSLLFPEVASASPFYHYEDESADITQWATGTVWTPRKFDPILRLVADDEIRYVSWMNMASGEIFAPYDGGADLFLSSTRRRDELRTDCSGWFSRHPEGV